jgi:hypothetical protein
MRLLVFIFLFIIIYSCSKNCNSNNLTCNDSPPTDELCDAYFTRWFYNKSKNACEEISYSGCSAKGFETKAACDSCKCK